MPDKKIYLHFTGYHAVAAASDVLTGYHIENRIVKAPVNMANSCSFAVMIDETDEDMAVYLLERSNLRTKRT